MEAQLTNRFNYRKYKVNLTWLKINLMGKCLSKGWKLTQRKSLSKYSKATSI